MARGVLSNAGMLNRRELLSRLTTTLLLIPIATNCSSSSSPPNQQQPHPDAPEPDSGGGCDGFERTSTVDASHTHMVCILTADLTNPPAAGVTYVTTSVGSHTHNVTLTSDQLTMIQAGTEVTVVTSSTVDPINGFAHTHQFMIMKM